MVSSLPPYRGTIAYSFGLISSTYRSFRSSKSEDSRSHFGMSDFDKTTPAKTMRSKRSAEVMRSTALKVSKGRDFEQADLAAAPRPVIVEQADEESIV